MSQTEPPPCAVRLATAADAQVIAEIHVSSWQAAYRGIVPDDVLDGLSVSRHAREWQRHFADPGRGARVWVAEERAVVGFALTEPAEDRDLDPRAVLELVAIYVHPTRWGRGIGRRLLDASFLDAEERGFAWVTLWVLDANVRAQKLYERLGFAPDGGEEVRHIGGVDLPVTRFRRASRRG